MQYRGDENGAGQLYEEMQNVPMPVVSCGLVKRGRRRSACLLVPQL